MYAYVHMQSATRLNCMRVEYKKRRLLLQISAKTTAFDFWSSIIYYKDHLIIEFYYSYSLYFFFTTANIFSANIFRKGE